MPPVAEDTNVVQIGDWQLLPQRNLLRRAGHETRLEPRHADLLLFLARHRGEVFSADQIIEQVWRGQVVTDQSVYQAIAKLRKAVGDEASDPRYIETVPKRGYRLIAEATATSATVPLATAGKGGATLKGLPRGRWLGAGLVAATLLVLAWALLQTEPATDPAQGNAVVAVLPFDVLSDEPDDHLIAAGFAIELAHALGRSRHVRVIGPASTALATRLGDDSQEIGQHVDASIVVSGSIRRSGDSLRVSCALTEIPSGFQLWSTVFDRDDDNILTTQQEVAAAITLALSSMLKVSPDALPSPAQTADAATYDNYLLGRYYRHRRTASDLERAKQYFRQALAIDPDYVTALHELAAADLLLSFYGDEPLSEAVAGAESHLTRAAELAPEAPEVLALIGLSHYMQGSYGIAEDFLLRAVSTHTNLQEAWMWLGLARQQQGRLHDALAAFEYSSQLEPLLVTAVVNYANALSWSGNSLAAKDLMLDLANKANATMDNRDQLFRALSGVLRQSGELGEAVIWSERAIEAAPESELSQANMVIMLTLLGDIDGARQLTSQLFDETPPGRGTMDFLIRGNAAAPGIVDQAWLNTQLEDLQRQPDTPEIEWRLANLRAGTSAYFLNDFERAARLLEKAMRGRDFPVSRSDDDLYACASLVDALERNGELVAATRQLSQCMDDRLSAERQGWRSLTMAITETRLAVLNNDLAAARKGLAGLFERGLRNEFIIANDPIIGRLRDTEEFMSLIARIRRSAEAARQSLSLPHSQPAG